MVNSNLLSPNLIAKTFTQSLHKQKFATVIHAFYVFSKIGKPSIVGSSTLPFS